MADTVFNRLFDEADLEKIVADWLLSRYGLKLVGAGFRTTLDGVAAETASIRAQACSKCDPEFYGRIRRHMDSKLVNRDCPSCGERRQHAAFLADKADRLEEVRIC